MTRSSTTTVKTFLSFSKLLGEMKHIERWSELPYWGYAQTRRQRESNADHSWRMAMMAMMLKGSLKRKFNLERALKIALVHDIAEIITGDANPSGADGTGEQGHAFNEKIKAARSKAEVRAAKKIFSRLKTPQAKEFFEFWMDYEEQRSFEARVVKALDKIEALMQIFEYLKGHITKKQLDFLVRYVKKNVAGVDPMLDNCVREIFSKHKAKFLEYNLQLP